MWKFRRTSAVAIALTLAGGAAAYTGSYTEEELAGAGVAALRYWESNCGGRINAEGRRTMNAAIAYIGEDAVRKGQILFDAVRGNEPVWKICLAIATASAKYIEGGEGSTAPRYRGSVPGGEAAGLSDQEHAYWKPLTELIERLQSYGSEKK